jgi:hypothetical protein
MIQPSLQANVREEEHTYYPLLDVDLLLRHVWVQFSNHLQAIYIYIRRPDRTQPGKEAAILMTQRSRSQNITTKERKTFKKKASTNTHHKTVATQRLYYGFNIKIGLLIF